MRSLKVLVACEFSCIVRDAFIKKGHYAISCDLLPPENSGPHIQEDVLTILNDGWDLMIAHPPCTYLTNAGVRHLHDHVVSRLGNRTAVYGEARWKAMREGAEFFNALKNAPIKRIAVENPVPHKYAKEIIGNYDQLVRPWMFGNPETKAICLWLKNLPKLQPTNIIKEREHNIHYMSPSPDRWKNRSRFFPEVAKAMTDQWGGL
uniref:Methyltransferase n=1 Tax=viral metagenome TaxID=1070528 RepID=A0A6M3L8I0_9ZZZZ